MRLHLCSKNCKSVLFAPLCFPFLKSAAVSEFPSVSSEFIYRRSIVFIVFSERHYCETPLFIPLHVQLHHGGFISVLKNSDSLFPVSVFLTHTHTQTNTHTLLVSTWTDSGIVVHPGKTTWVHECMSACVCMCVCVCTDNMSLSFAVDFFIFCSLTSFWLHTLTSPPKNKAVHRLKAEMRVCVCVCVFMLTAL